VNTPGPMDHALGNTLAVTVIGGFAGLTSYAWLAAPGAERPFSWLIPVFAVALAGTAGKARQRVRAYAAWKRSWETMAGDSPEGTAKPPKRRGLPPKAFFITLWCVLLLWMLTDTNRQVTLGYALGATTFLLLTAWGALTLLVRLIRRALRSSPAKASPGGHVVAICLPVPGSSATPGDHAAALPGYCRTLLTNGAQ
jgi:hypothetical protein